MIAMIERNRDDLNRRFSPGGLRKQGNRETHQPIQSHLQQNAGQDHRTRRRSLGVSVRQPSMEREHGDLDGEGNEESPEQPDLHLERNDRYVHEVFEREACEPELLDVLEVERQDGQQHQHRAGQRVEEELDGRVETPRAAPNADDEIHRHQHDLPENIEEKQVNREEHAQHACLQQQEHGVILFDAVLNRRPGAENGQEPDDGRQHHQQQADAIQPQVIPRAQRRDPVEPFDKLKLSRRHVEPEDQRQRDQEAHEADDVSQQANQLLFLFRDEDQQEHPHQGGEPDNAKDMFSHCVRPPDSVFRGDIRFTRAVPIRQKT